MTTATLNPAPRWYGIVAVLAVLWMLFGAFALIMDAVTDEAALAELSEAQRQLYAARPAWIFFIYAVAVLSGLAGAVGLLLRKRWAVEVLALSLVAVVVQFSYLLIGMGAVEVLGPAAALPFPLTIFTIGAALVWLAWYARREGWLG